MSPAPYGVRLLVGAAATAVEETLKLPQTILTYPMTLVSQAAHLVMKVQQNVADLVIKGDETLETIFPPKDEQPPWATFDEDYDDKNEPVDAPTDTKSGGEGRFALYSTTPDVEEPGPIKKAAEKAAQDKRAGGHKTTADKPPIPEIVEELDYDSLTLAQLRARLQSLSVPELEALQAYEDAHGARAPFQTLLANRIIRASAK